MKKFPRIGVKLLKSGNRNMPKSSLKSSLKSSPNENHARMKIIFLLHFVLENVTKGYYGRN